MSKQHKLLNVQLTGDESVESLKILAIYFSEKKTNITEMGNKVAVLPDIFKRTYSFFPFCVTHTHTHIDHAALLQNSHVSNTQKR